MADATLSGALVRWQHGAGDLWPYVCAAPFVGPAYRPVSARRTERLAPIADALAGLGEVSRPALFVDLPPEPVLCQMADLGAQGFVVVPVIQRWCADPAVIASGSLRSALVAAARHARHHARPRGYVFVLDGERAGPRSRVVPGRAFDNRYAYRACRFPPPEVLRAAGVGRIGWLSTRGIASDMADYALSLAAAGLPPRPLTV